VIGNDSVKLSGGTAIFADKNAGNSKTVTLSGATLSGTDVGNYALDSVAATTAKITPAPLTITAMTYTKVYDSNTSAAAIPTVSGLQGIDTVTGRAETYDTKHVGTSKALTVSAYTINDGNSGNNYSVSTVADSTGVITKASLTISALANTKGYDGSTSAAAVPAHSGTQGTDSVTGLVETYDNKNAGINKTLSVVGYTVNDGNSGNNYNITTVNNTTGVIYASGTGTTVNSNINTVQYSDTVKLTAMVTPSVVGGENVSGSVEFLVNGTPYGTAAVGLGGIATLTASILLPPGPYPIQAKFTSGTVNFSNSSGSTAQQLTITQEDARVAYTGSLFVAGSSTTASSATVAFSATIQDITAVVADPAWDGNVGDIRNATITFINRDSGNAPICSAPIGLVALSDIKTGTATCSASLNIGNTGAQSYNIGFVIGGHYLRNSSDDDFVVTVYAPLTSSFITGGGYLTMSSSAGMYPGGAGTKNNFGFNVKYNKQGTNLQGNINSIVRNNGRVYQIKGNSMTSLSVTPSAGCVQASTTSPCTATFNGKASIQDITDPANVLSIDGNATLQVTMTDKGDTSGDTLGITVWNKAGGVWFSSNWNGTKTIEQLINGGNLTVH
jgi:hypothetical protein